MNNPFRVGTVVRAGDYIEPQNSVLASIAQHIFSGESIAITGEPRIGKTSLLTYLSSKRIVDSLNSIYKERQLVFRLMDYHLFQREDFTQKEFWQYALTPVEDALDNPDYSSVKSALSQWKMESSTFGLSNLFSEMSQHKICLVLCVDEFDDVLSHPVLGKGEFLGALRAMTTREPSLSMIISSRIDISELNERTNLNHRPGSPFFNHFIQLILGCFSNESARRLLNKAQSVFSDHDKTVILKMAGLHPYFLQIAASALWEEYNVVFENNPNTRLDQVWRKLCVQALSTLDDAWNFWTIRTKQVLSIIALDDAPRLLGTKTFDTKSLRQELSFCTNEIMFLELRGYIFRNKDGR